MADTNKLELVRKVKALVDARHNGDYRKAFDYYDSAFARDAKIGKKELDQMLDDAQVGTVFTRSAWVEGIIRELDSDNDGQIAWGEFEFALKR